MMRKRFLGLALAAVVLAGCGSDKKPAATEEAKSSPPPPVTEKAPDVFAVKFDTSKGPFIVEVHREWAPNGADRFYELTKAGFFEDVRFFRVIKGFIAQFGINGEPRVARKWRNMNIVDDPAKESNLRGTLTFATAGPNTRTTQLFINLADNPRLNQSGFAPFGKVVDGMQIVDQLYAGYGEDPSQPMIESQGNQYLTEHYPKLDFVKSAQVLK